MNKYIGLDKNIRFYKRVDGDKQIYQYICLHDKGVCLTRAANKI